MLGGASLNLVAHRLLWHKSAAAPDLRARDAAGLGMAGGALMLAAKWCAMTAAGDTQLGEVVTDTVLSAGTFVSGAWGVALFGEVRGLLQLLFWFCGLQLAGACSILVMSQRVAC
jgi:hypothetical protein